METAPQAKGNRDGEARADGELEPALVARREQRMRSSTVETRCDRADLSALAKPQGGVDALAGSFPKASGAPAGVADNGDRSTRAVPEVTVRQPR